MALAHTQGALRWFIQGPHVSGELRSRPGPLGLSLVPRPVLVLRAGGLWTVVLAPCRANPEP